MSDDLPVLLDDGVTSRAEQRQTERLPNGYKPITGVGLTFDPRLTFELALAYCNKAPTDSIWTDFGYDATSAAELIATPVFQRTLKAYVDDVTENGITYRQKARVIAEDLLTHAHEIATDPEAPYATRADLIKWSAKVADYEPKQQQQAAQGNGFALQIVFSGEAKKEPLLVHGEVIENERAEK